MRLSVLSFVVGLALAFGPARAATVDALAAPAAQGLSFTQTAPLNVSSAGRLILGTLGVASGGIIGDVNTLNLSIAGVAGKTPFVLDLIYQFTKTAGKPKFIAITSLLAQPLSVKSGKYVYTISVDGFVEALGASVMARFNPPKPGNSRSLLLQGNVTVAEAAPVPLPAAGLVLLGALGAIAMIRRRPA
ncbi:MAG: hypothetical protein ACKVPY_02435 [Paracoccaceae bacterium]